MSWKVVTHSAIGTRHLSRGLPCQDYGNYCIKDDVLFGAVSDGAGSAKFSDLGSKVAVETYLKTIQSEFEALDLSNLDPAKCSRNEFSELFSRVSNTIVQALAAEAAQGDFPLKELGCTLLGFIASQHWIAAMQIGDGFIVFQPQDQEDIQLLFRPDKGEFINETLFVTSQGALDEIPVILHPCRPQFVCAATDGLESVAIRFQDWQPHRPFFKPFIDCLTLIPEIDEQKNYVKTFLESDRLNAKTDDDKTLLIGLCPTYEDPLCVP